jgi:hypothetical protein
MQGPGLLIFEGNELAFRSGSKIKFLGRFPKKLIDERKLKCLICSFSSKQGSAL